MELPKEVVWRWKEGLRFALADHFRRADLSSLTYKKTGLESFGSFWVDPVYKIIGWVAVQLRKPVLIIFITLSAALFSIFIFYNVAVFAVLGKFFPTTAFRFLTFLYFELIGIGLGCRAFGRFSNLDLVDLWKRGEVIALFPGSRHF